MYIFNKADGKQTEGIGAVAQCQIHTYTLSKMLSFLFSCPRATLDTNKNATTISKHITPLIAYSSVFCFLFMLKFTFNN